MLSLAEQLRQIADSGDPEREVFYLRFKERIEHEKERKLLMAFADAAKDGHCHYGMGRNLAPVELIAQGIRFTVMNRQMVAYW